MQRRWQRSELVAWILVASWTALIFAMVPIVRRFQEWVATRTGGGEVFGYATIGLLGVSGATAMITLFRRSKRPSIRRVLWLGAVAAVSIWWATRLWAQPEEAVHLVEYGVLGLLLAHAASFREATAVRFLSAALLGAIIGVADELLQWITPSRYFDFRDIWINAGAVILAQIALWKGLAEARPSPPVTAQTFRLPLRLATTLLVALGICWSLTPQRLYGWSQRFSWIPFDGEDVVAEYGYRHEVDDIGVFNSRLTLDELARFDRETGTEVAREIIDFDGRYPEFLRTFHAGNAPFAHEARVHLHNRDHNIRLAMQNQGNPNEKATRFGRADRENRILERFFKETTSQSGRQLKPQQLTRVQETAVREFDFTSKAGSHLITSISEVDLRMTVVAAIVLLFTADRLGSRRKTP